jgi:hypothetical protein
VLFFSFWQSVLIAILSHFDVLTGIGSWTEFQISVLFQDLAICLEMYLLSILHIFAFEYLTYEDKMIQVDTSLKPVLSNFASTVSQRDLLDSVKESYLDRSAGKTARSEFQEHQMNEQTRLLAKSSGGEEVEEGGIFK